MAAVAFASVARQDAENARLMSRRLPRRSSLMKIRFRSCAIRRLAFDGQRCHRRAGEMARYAIMRSQSTSLIERRVRMALAPAIVAA